MTDRNPPSISVENLFDESLGATPRLESLHSQTLPLPSRTPKFSTVDLVEQDTIPQEVPEVQSFQPAQITPDNLIRQSLSTKMPVESSPDRYTLDLPSGLVLYTVKSVSCMTPRAKHQAKFHRAAKEKRTRHLVDAVSSLLDPEFSAWDMTYPDFVWTLYWLRLNGFTKQSLVHHGVCDNEAHIRDVISGKKKEQTLVSVQTITKTTLKDTALDFAPVLKYLEENAADLAFLQESSYRLHLQTMRDIVALEEDFSALPDFAETEYNAQFAGCLTGADGNYVPLADRLKFVDELTVDQLETLNGYLNLVSDYGVVETVKFTCPECRAVVESPVSISAHSFL